MKFNKWTLGLAAVGAVSLTSAVTARAVESNLNPVSAALAGITISGGIDTSIEWAATPKDGHYYQSPGGNYIPFRGSLDPNKQDGFNLNVVELTLEKPLGEEQWASGFKAQLLFGPDASNYGNTSANTESSDVSIKQAYVNLRTPVGNGLEWKVGVFDTVIGYEVFESWNNPNFTRSYGYYWEPTAHTGILASYNFNDNVSASLGVANTHWAGINQRYAPASGNPRDNDTKWQKTVMGSLTLTAPQSWGWLAGAKLYSGVVYSHEDEDILNAYVGTVMQTPVTGLSVGLSYDLLYTSDDFGSGAFTGTYHDYQNIIGLYASYKATEKLSFHGRAEWWNSSFNDDYDNFSSAEGCTDYYELTFTTQYDLWANVVSRLELRWDHNCDYDNIGGYTDFSGESPRFVSGEEDSVGLYLNIDYKF